MEHPFLGLKCHREEIETRDIDNGIGMSFSTNLLPTGSTPAKNYSRGWGGRREMKKSGS